MIQFHCGNGIQHGTYMSVKHTHTSMYIYIHAHVHTYRYIHLYMHPSINTYIHMCHKGMVSQTMSSIVYVQGLSLQCISNQKKTNDEANNELLFGNSDLQRMFVQFTP